MLRDRRQFLASVGAVSVGAIAGCTGGNGSTRTYEGTKVDVPSEAASYLEDTSNFDGEAIDWTAKDNPTIEVGVEANGNFFGFGPPAVKISTGTTVTWEWTGEGASHNVVDEDGAFQSQNYIEEGKTFEHTFESAGTYRYFCSPHKVNGMKGVVIVA